MKWTPMYIVPIGFLVMGAAMAFADPDGAIRFLGWLFMVGSGVLAGRISKGGIR